MFLDTRPNQTNNSRTSTSTNSNSTNSGIHFNNNDFTSNSLSSLAAGSSLLPSPATPTPAALVSGSSNVTDIDSVVTKATAFKRFKSKLVKKKEKTGSGQGKGEKGKPYEEEVVPGLAGCPNDVAESSSKTSTEKFVVADEVVVSENSLLSENDNDVGQHSSTSGSDVGAADSRTESATKLAHRIQTLLSLSCSPSNFFPFSNPTNSTTTKADESVAAVVREEEEIPPSSQQQPPQSNTTDSRFKLVPDSLFKLHLPDTKFMNFLTTSPHSNIVTSGTKSSSDSLHDVLDKWTRFVIRKQHHPKTIESETASHENNDIVGDDNDSDCSSVVLSCPLEPTSETKVEIARSEVISVDLDAEPSSIESSTPLSFLSIDRNSFWSSFGKTSQQNTAATDSNAPSPSKSSRLKEIRVWYPSRTQVSLEATWWGYRIYLPPPVMQILSDKSLEAAKRAAMITAALTWLVSRIPLEVLPLQFKPLTLILKEIVPLIGYVGGFIAWSWNTVKGFDKGDGVVLSATWLLPIALIPGTWIYTEPSSDIPLENLFGGSPTTAKPSSSPPPPPPKDTSSTTSRSVFASVAGLTQVVSRQPGSSSRQA